MASNTGGVKPMPIQGRMTRERERILGMTPEERKWRAQYLKDQNLSHSEPREVPEYYKEVRNPIRRFYRAPLDAFGRMLTPVMGKYPAAYVRYFTGKFAMIGVGVLGMVYYFKYNANDWTKKGGWRVIKSRPLSTPGTPGWPKVSERTKPSDYANRGFADSPI